MHVTMMISDGERLQKIRASLFTAPSISLSFYDKEISASSSFFLSLIPRAEQRERKREEMIMLAEIASKENEMMTATDRQTDGRTDRHTRHIEKERSK